MRIIVVLKGGPGSGNWGHIGRRYRVGGSLPTKNYTRQGNARKLGKLGMYYGDNASFTPRLGYAEGGPVMNRYGKLSANRQLIARLYRRSFTHDNIYHTNAADIISDLEGQSSLGDFINNPPPTNESIFEKQSLNDFLTNNHIDTFGYTTDVLYDAFNSINISDPATLLKTFNYTDTDNTWLSTKIRSMKKSVGDVEIRGLVYDKDGKDCGNFTRTFSKNRNGELAINHEYFSIDESLEGGGFTTRWFEQCENSYRAAGITKINVHANINVGGYTWARLGFDFNYDTSLNEFKEALAFDYRRYTGKSMPDSVLSSLKHAWDIAAVRIPMSDVIRNDSSYFSSIRALDTTNNMLKLGAITMLGSDWMGHKSLNDDLFNAVGQSYYASKRKK